MKSTKRFGLFGGSFDPVHRGHVALAAAAKKELELDRIYFVPARVSPHKQAAPPAASRHRLHMLKLATRSDPSFRVSLWEIRARGVSYTERTLRAFKRRFPRARWFLILGGDSLSGFPRWRNWRWLLRQSQLIVGRRKPAAGAKGGAGTAGLPKLVRKKAVFLKAKLPEVSSSRVRGRVKSRQPVRSLLPPPVADYILRHGVYS